MQRTWPPKPVTTQKADLQGPSAGPDLFTPHNDDRAGSHGPWVESRQARGLCSFCDTTGSRLKVVVLSLRLKVQGLGFRISGLGSGIVNCCCCSSSRHHYCDDRTDCLVLGLISIHHKKLPQDRCRPPRPPQPHFAIPHLKATNPEH